MDVQNALNISRSNGLLGSQERAHFEQLAEAYEAELLELRQQIEETKTRKRLSLLESRVEETERNLSVSKILSKPSPIRRLPPELLSLVFILACAGEKLDVRLFKESTPPTLLSLLRICKHWRGLAFTTKGVWGTLVFIEEDLDIWRKSNDESDANKAIRVMEGVVNLYGKNLSRLSLDWNFVEGVNRRLFDLVFQNQCQFVSLVLYGGNHIYEYCSTFEMPVLEELLLRCVHHRGKQLSAQFDAPKLRKVFLSPPGEGGDITPDNPLLPWNQITHLSFGMPGVERGSCHIPARYFFDLLPQLSCLTYLHITGVSLPKRRRDHLNPELALPHLKALEVFDHYLSFLLNSPFLTSVSAPSLETLDIFFSVSTFARNGLHKALVPFLQQTPSLRQVRFVAYSEKETLWGRFCQDQLFLQLTGDGPFFAHLSHVTGEGDKNLAQFAQTRSIPKKEWLDGELWTDRLIDRYINRFPVIYLPVAEAGLGGSRCGPEGGEGTTVRDDADGSQSEGEDEDARDETDDDLAINLESGVITEEAKRKVVEMFFREQDRGHRESIRAILFPLLGDFRIPAHVERHVYVFLDHLQ